MAEIAITDYFKTLDSGKTVQYRSIGDGPILFVTEDAPVVVIQLQEAYPWLGQV